MKGFLLTVFLVVALFFGIAVKHGDVQLPTMPALTAPSTTPNIARQTAGHAFTPNQYNITSSIERLWYQNDDYRRVLFRSALSGFGIKTVFTASILALTWPTNYSMIGVCLSPRCKG